MHLREFLIREYQQNGWLVCSDSFESSACLPDGWTGVFPDLLAMKGSRKEALCIETASSFTGDQVPMKWKSILRNPEVLLVIIVRDNETYQLAVQAAESHDIMMVCRIMRKKIQKKHTHRKHFLRKRVYLFGLIGGVVLVFIAFFLVFPSARSFIQKQQLKQSYRPADLDRQIESLRKEADKMKK